MRYCGFYRVFMNICLYSICHLCNMQILQSKLNCHITCHVIIPKSDTIKFAIFIYQRNRVTHIKSREKRERERVFFYKFFFFIAIYVLREIKEEKKYITLRWRRSKVAFAVFSRNFFTFFGSLVFNGFTYTKIHTHSYI